MNNKLPILLFFTAVTLLLFILVYQKPTVTTTTSIETTTTTPSVLGTQTKNSGCVTQNALPDKACTPGAIFTNVTKEQVCTPGYSKTVRNVSDTEKNTVYAEYGIVTHKTGDYEVDHYISLELGGSNDLANLWPEAANPTPGFHEKDKVENFLHEQVCNGSITLQKAQQDISTDWLSIYQQMQLH